MSGSEELVRGPSAVDGPGALARVGDRRGGRNGQAQARQRRDQKRRAAQQADDPVSQPSPREDDGQEHVNELV